MFCEAKRTAAMAREGGVNRRPAGRVSITRIVSDREPLQLVLRWQEGGGPLVLPPTRKEFGTRLMGAAWPVNPLVSFVSAMSRAALCFECILGCAEATRKGSSIATHCTM